MPTLATIREQRRSERLSGLCQGVRAAAAAFPQTQVWLFGSLARGDWDACSDEDLLAMAPAKPEAEALADALLARNQAGSHPPRCAMTPRAAHLAG